MINDWINRARADHFHWIQCKMTAIVSPWIHESGQNQINRMFHRFHFLKKHKLLKRYLNSRCPGHRDRLDIERKFATIRCTNRVGRRANGTRRDPLNRWTCRIRGRGTRTALRHVGKANTVERRRVSCCTSSPTCRVLRNKLHTRQSQCPSSLAITKKKHMKNAEVSTCFIDIQSWSTFLTFTMDHHRFLCTIDDNHSICLFVCFPDSKIQQEIWKKKKKNRTSCVGRTRVERTMAKSMRENEQMLTFSSTLDF